MKKKVRFGELKEGDSFEWGGKSLTKDGMRNATSLSPRTQFVFATRDMVTVNVPDTEDDDWDDMIVPGIGFVGGGAISSADDDDAVNPQDLYDAYVYNATGSSRDKCN